jgi:hypothetical protein
MIKSILEDRFMKGLTAGLLAGIFGVGWNLFSTYILKLSTLLWDAFLLALFFEEFQNKFGKLFYQKL